MKAYFYESSDHKCAVKSAYCDIEEDEQLLAAIELHIKNFGTIRIDLDPEETKHLIASLINNLIPLQNEIKLREKEQQEGKKTK